MNVLAIIVVAWRTLGRHATRSALTALGIIVGVASVITMVAIGSGARRLIEEQVSSMGVNTMMLFPGSTRVGAVRGGMGTVTTFTEADAKAIERECPSIKACIPLVRYRAQVIAGAENWPTRIYGVYPNYFPYRGWTICAGQGFSEQDERAATKVCILGQTVVDNLFPGGANPVGATVRIANMPFQVIGVLARKGQAPWGEDQDDLIYAPFSTVQRRLLNINFVHTIECWAAAPQLISYAEDEVRALLRQRRRIPEGEDDDFVIRSQLDVLKASTESSRVMRLLLGAIASVSLLVGGIGIMNVMLVSVTERTREIGIRMAIGARRSDVLLQFVVEAVTLSLLGGLLGLVVGFAATRIVQFVLHWPTFVSLLAVLLSLGSACATGIAFGIYPAFKAARLDPIEALRYE